MLSTHLGDAAFWRAAMRLALPIALQNLLTSSFILVDTLMVGQLGDLALSAVGMAGQFGWFLNMVLFGICSGAAVFIAQYWGAEDMPGIRRTYGIALLFALGVSALFLMVAAAFPAGVIRVFNRDAAVVEAGVSYLKIACWSYPAIAMSNVFSVALRSTEQVKLPMVISLFTTVLNALLDYTLIFGALGFPAMGVQGAALATAISAWAGPLLTLAVSAAQRNLLSSPPRQVFRFSREALREYMAKSAPVIFNETMWGLGTLLFSVIFANLGYQNYAAVTIFRTFENICFAFFIGLCNACCIMIGKQVGAGEIADSIRDARRFTYIIVLLSILTGGLVAIFRNQLASIFNLSGNISPETLATTGILILIYGLELPIRNIPYIQIVGIFRSGGDTATGVKLDLLSLWFCSVPVTALSAFVLRLPFWAVFAIMYIAEDYLKVYLCVRHFRSLRWIRPVTEQGIKGLEEYMAGRGK